MHSSVRPRTVPAGAVLALALAIALQLASGIFTLLDSARAESPPPVVEVATALPAVTPDVPELRWVTERPVRGAAEEEAPDPSAELFAAAFPAQAAAEQRAGDPTSFHWAVIAGVNAYQRATSNTLGSVSDAQTLKAALLDRGWREEHILVLLDGQATHDWMVRGIEWLTRKTDGRSTVVFSSSGHMRHANGVTALWPADNSYIWAEDFGRLIGAVEAERMWISLQGCHAEGLRAPGVEGPNRVVTYSSKTAEKSYEDPEVGHSVQGNYLFAEGLRTLWGDADGDGLISVQEAFAWAAPRAFTRTSGRQTMVLADGLTEPFHLEVPPTRRTSVPSVWPR